MKLLDLCGFVLCIGTSIVKIHCAEDVELNLSLAYFKYKNISLICLLTSQNNGWKYKFTRKAMKESMMVSSVDVTKPNLNKKNLMSCLTHTRRPLGILVHSQRSEFIKLMQWASEELLLSDNHNWLIIHAKTIKENNSTYFDQYSEDIGVDKDIRRNELSFEESNKNVSTVLEIFESLNISIDADIKVVIKTGVNAYTLMDIFNFGRVQGGFLNITPIGSWTEDKELEIWLNTYKYRQRWDFFNLPLRMIVVSGQPKLFKPEMLMSLTKEEDVNKITRIGSMIFNIIAEVHNFRFEYTVSDRWIGSLKSNSTRVASNSLYFREQDVTPVLRFQDELMNKIHFLCTSVADLRTKYYYRIPNYGVGKFENKFLTPLSPGAWGCILAVSVLCCLVLLVAAKLEHRPAWAQYAVFTVFASVCQQFFESGDNEIRRVSSARKLTVVVTGISCVLLYNYYTSSVVSWLLNGPPPSINSLRELLESPLELIFEDVGYTKSWLQIPTYFFDKRNAKVEEELRNRKVFTKKKGDPLLMSINEGIEMVKAGGYAFHVQEAIANTRISETFTKMELCELGYLQSMPKTELYPALQKHSPFKEFFEWRLARLKETGHISCIQRRMAGPDISCDGSVPQALALGGAAPAFALLAFGYLASLIVLALEILRHRRMEKKWNVIVPFTN